MGHPTGRTPKFSYSEDILDLSIVIVNWNTEHLLPRCLDAVYGTLAADMADPLEFEVLVVDNGSTDGSADLIRRDYPTVRLIASRTNLGFAGGNNLAFRQMKGRYALLLNTDAFLQPGAARKLVRFMDAHPQAGMACGQLFNPDGSRQNSIANFPSIPSLLFNETLLRLAAPNRYPSKHRTYSEPIRVDSCIGACMIVRAEAMEEVGLLDEGYFFFMEETDWAFRMHRAGWDVWFTQAAETIHAQGQSVGHGAASRKLFFKSRYRYFRKWRPRIWPLMHALSVGRLAVNSLLALAGTILTLGLEKSTRLRLQRYLILLGWHFRGCPEEWNR